MVRSPAHERGIGDVARGVDRSQTDERRAVRDRGALLRARGGRRRRSRGRGRRGRRVVTSRARRGGGPGGGGGRKAAGPRGAGGGGGGAAPGRWSPSPRRGPARFRSPCCAAAPRRGRT